jgi:hypothetical protein
MLNQEISSALRPMKALATGETPPLAELEAGRLTEALRTTGETMVKSLGGLLDLLEEGSPLKKAFLDTKAEINKALAGLPTTDKIPAALASNSLLRDLVYIFAQAQDLMKTLGNATVEARKGLASATTELPTKIADGVKVELNRLVAAGDYVPKADVEVTVQKALAGAAKEVSESATRIETRKKALATAQLPVVFDDKTLALPDDKWNLIEVDFKGRMEKLKKFNLPETRIKALASIGIDGFNEVLATLEERGSGTGGRDWTKVPADQGQNQTADANLAFA